MGCNGSTCCSSYICCCNSGVGCCKSRSRCLNNCRWCCSNHTDSDIYCPSFWVTDIYCPSYCGYIRWRSSNVVGIVVEMVDLVIVLDVGVVNCYSC